MITEEKQARIAQINTRMAEINEKLKRIYQDIAQLEDAKREIRKKGLQKLGQVQEQIKEGGSQNLIKKTVKASEELQQELTSISRNANKLRKEAESIQKELCVIEAEKNRLRAS